MKTILISVLLAALARAGCLAVSSGQITVRDLRDAVPFLQQLDLDTPLGFSPLPGTQRILSARELTLLAQRHGLTLVSGGPCPAYASSGWSGLFPVKTCRQL